MVLDQLIESNAAFGFDPKEIRHQKMPEKGTHDCADGQVGIDGTNMPPLNPLGDQGAERGNRVIKNGATEHRRDFGRTRCLVQNEKRDRTGLLGR